MTAELATAHVTIPGDNPLTVVEIERYAAILRDLLTGLDWQVVSTALIGESEGDLLDAVSDEVQRVREFLHRRIGMVLQPDSRCVAALAVLDCYSDKLGTARVIGHDDSSSVARGTGLSRDTPTVGATPATSCCGDSRRDVAAGGAA